jgi:threonine/homoserine/homoserine lactone efflux protein
MAWGTLRSGGALQIAEREATVPSTKIVISGFLLNILNPKLSIFFLAFLPQFVPSNIPNPTAHMLGLAAIFMLLTFVVFVGYGAFASATRRYVIANPSIMLWLRRGFAGAFGLLGLKLAIAHQ